MEIVFDALLNTNNVSSNTFNGSQSGFGSKLFQDLDAGKLIFGAATSGIFTYATRGFALTTLYRMMQNKDITEILAQPRLVMKNGRSAGFFACAQFPVVTSTSEKFEVEFRPFGVRLDFVPTLTLSVP